MERYVMRHSQRFIFFVQITVFWRAAGLAVQGQRDTVPSGTAGLGQQGIFTLKESKYKPCQTHMSVSPYEPRVTFSSWLLGRRSPLTPAISSFLQTCTETGLYTRVRNQWTGADNKEYQVH